MTNILIPTDFTPASLQVAEQAIQVFDIKCATITLFHAFELPTSEYELLTPARRKPYADLMTDQFRNACRQFKEQQGKRVAAIHFRFMEGSTAKLFRNFVDANEIDLIICPDHYNYIPVHRTSVDPRPLFKKSGVKIIRDFSRNRVPVHTEEKAISPVFVTAGG